MTEPTAPPRPPPSSVPPSTTAVKVCNSSGSPTSGSAEPGLRADENARSAIKQAAEHKGEESVHSTEMPTACAASGSLPTAIYRRAEARALHTASQRRSPPADDNRRRRQHAGNRGAGEQLGQGLRNRPSWIRHDRCSVTPRTRNIVDSVTTIDCSLHERDEEAVERADRRADRETRRDRADLAARWFPAELLRRRALTSDIAAPAERSNPPTMMMKVWPIAASASGAPLVTAKPCRSSPVPWERWRREREQRRKHERSRDQAAMFATIELRMRCPAAASESSWRSSRQPSRRRY